MRWQFNDGSYIVLHRDTGDFDVDRERELTPGEKATRLDFPMFESPTVITMDIDSRVDITRTVVVQGTVREVMSRLAAVLLTKATPTEIRAIRAMRVKYGYNDTYLVPNGVTVGQLGDGSYFNFSSEGPNQYRMKVD